MSPIRLPEALTQMASLLRTWGLGEADWIFTGNYAYVLLGFSAPVRSGHHNILVRRTRLPWPAPEQAIDVHPPLDSKYHTAYQNFVARTDHDFDLLPQSGPDMERLLAETVLLQLPGKQSIVVQSPIGQLKVIEALIMQGSWPRHWRS